mgnify:CR=1 FL=1
MRPLKKILGNETARRFICWLGAAYIRLAYATGRWTVVGGEIPQHLWDQGKPFILGFWHGRMLMMPFCWDKRADIHMLVSAHPDGQLGAQAMSHLGIKSVTGSSSSGGSQALRALVKLLKEGNCSAIAPDGPRGPRMRASDGVINLARLSGVPIVPVAFGVSRRQVVASWDRFIVAWPFARGVFVWGEMIEVPRDADAAAVAAARLRVEDSLNRITAEADRLCGWPAMAPAELAPTGEGAAT